jgi:hypothetical protein
MNRVSPASLRLAARLADAEDGPRLDDLTLLAIQRAAEQHQDLSSKSAHRN